MRISLLLRREPFADILTSTLSHFWSNHYGSQVQVTWHSKQPDWSDSSNNAAQVWYVNFYLNSIFSTSADQGIFQPIRREYERSLTWYLRLPQCIYLNLALSAQVAKCLANAQLLVSPRLADADKLLVIPGNHKIRVLDFNSHLVYGVLKQGFRQDTFDREVGGRRVASQCGVSVPRLREVSNDWFCEQYVCGTPTNRLASPNSALKAERDALQMLRKLSLETTVETNVRDHVGSLVDRIVHLLEEATELQRKVKLALLKNVSSLKKWILDNATFSTVPVSLSHGDLQSGNILVNSDGVWIIDWEYCGYRIDGYDWLVLALHSRRSRNLWTRAYKFVQTGIDSEYETTLPIWPGTSWRTKVDRTVLCSLFFLEELLLHLEEASEPLLFSITNEVQGINAEITMWLNSLDHSY